MGRGARHRVGGCRGSGTLRAEVVRRGGESEGSVRAQKGFWRL